MKYLLFEGAANTGKTSAVIRIANHLVNNFNYQVVAGNTIPSVQSKKDFYSLMENSTTRKRIVVNSPSDYITVIDDFKCFYDNNQPVDIVISSCREEKYLREHFYTSFNINDSDDVVVIPLGKITRRNENLKKQSMKRYKECIDSLAQRFLEILLD